MSSDNSDMKSVLEGFARQCKDSMQLPKGMFVSGEISDIVILGMGGSAITGDIIKSLMGDSKTPVHVVRDYCIPSFVNEETLVFAISYSGNTEETLEATKAAMKRNAKVIGISSGGAMQGLVKKHIRVAEGFQPRCALGMMLFAVLGVLSNSKLIEIKTGDVNEALSLLENSAEFQERAKTIVKLMKGRTPTIYASENLRAVAMRWKTQYNENAKAPASFNTFSEMTHNEICQFGSLKRNEDVAILLKDTQDHARIQKRMEISKALMKENVDVIEVGVRGTSLLSRMLCTIHLGDWVAYYAALDRRVDPTPVEIIERLKKQME